MRFSKREGNPEVGNPFPVGNPDFGTNLYEFVDGQTIVPCRICEMAGRKVVLYEIMWDSEIQT